MPYDPRPVSQGGIRREDEAFSRKAPEGKFRLIGVDTFDGGDWLQGDFDTLDAAKAEAKKHAGEMTKMYVYNEFGLHCATLGRF